MKVIQSARRVAQTASLAAVATVCASGCASNSNPLASLNPFASAATTAPGDAVAEAPPAGTTTTDKLATMRDTAAGQANSLSLAASSAWTKTKNGVTGLFAGGGANEPGGEQQLAEDDPTRLSTPATVSPEVYVAQGALWETTGEFTKAMESYTRALQSEPNNAAALASVARLHLRQENFPQAAEHFRKAIAVNPKDATLHNDYGMTQAKLGDLDGAARSITTALEAAPGTSRFANNLANVRYDAGDSAGALAVLMQHNKPAVAHFNMAYLHYRGGDFAEAKTQLQQVLQYESLSDRDSAVAQAVARSRDMLGQMEGGVERIAQAAPRALATANQVIDTLSPAAAAVQQTSQSQAADAAADAPATRQAGAPPAGQPGTQPPFVLPPGVFDQPIR